MKCKGIFDSDRSSLGFSLAAVSVVFLVLLAGVIWLHGGVTYTKFAAFLWYFKTNNYPAVYQLCSKPIAVVHAKISAGLGSNIRPTGSKSS